MSEIKSFEDFLNKTNFNYLKQQKKALLNAQRSLIILGGEENLTTVATLEGLVNFLDTFQDMAVDVYGKDENEVFDLTEEDK